jgi:hypothetical protein
MLLVRLLSRQGSYSYEYSDWTIPKMLNQVSSIKPAVVCISALPPFALNHAANLYTKRGVRVQKCTLLFAYGSSKKTAQRRPFV